MKPNSGDTVAERYQTPFDFSTTRGKIYRVARWAQSPDWIRFAPVEDGKVCGHAEQLAPAPWTHTDQAAYLEYTLRERGHRLTAATVAGIRKYLNP